MPFRVFAAGEVLTAANVNDYLAEQAVSTFADSGARGSAIASPSEGQFAYLADTDSLTFYNGSAWVNAGSAIAGTALSSGTATSGQVLAANGSGGVSFSTPTQGLTLINTTSFSAVSSFSLPASTFTSTYNDYLLLVNFTAASTNLGLSIRMRAAGTDNTSASYDRGGIVQPINASSIVALPANGGTSWSAIEINSTYPTYSQMQMVFKSPNTGNAFKSAFLTATYVNGSGVGQTWWSNHILSSGTQFDSASFIASTGNFTGNYSVYGYNK